MSPPPSILSGVGGPSVPSNMTERELANWLEMARTGELAAWLYRSGSPDTQARYLRRLRQ